MYRTREVAELLGLSPAKVRRLARAGLLDVARDSGGYCFTFQDVVLLRGAAELESADLPARRVRSALRRLREQLPGRPLSAVQVGAEGGRVIAREAGSAWEPLTGQYVLLLEGAAPGATKESGDVTPLDRPPHEGGSLRAGERGPDRWFELGLELESTSSEEARRAYARTLELRPDHPDAHVNLGRLLHEQGELPAAEAHYRCALAASPESATAAFNLGVVLQDLGRAERAIEAYLRALAADPDLADAHFNLSRLYEDTGDRAAALRHLRSYSQLTRTS